MRKRFNYRSLLSFILVACVFYPLLSCESPEIKNASENIKEGTKKTGEATKELGREISEETRLIIEEIKKGTSAVVTEIKEGGILVSRKGELLIDRTREEFSEAAITATIKAKYAKSPKVSALHINITTDKGNVILSGTAHCKEEIVEAINLAMSVEGVKNVTSLLEMRE